MKKTAAKKGRSTRGVEPNIGKRELRAAARTLMLKKLKTKQKSNKKDTPASTPTKVTASKGNVGTKVVGLETPPPREPATVAPELMKNRCRRRKAHPRKLPHRAAHQLRASLLPMSNHQVLALFMFQRTCLLSSLPRRMFPARALRLQPCLVQRLLLQSNANEGQLLQSLKFKPLDPTLCPHPAIHLATGWLKQ